MLDKKFVSRVEIAGAIFGIALGTLLHFTYEWSGRSLVVGLLSAVNESVWEHNKMLFTPLLLYSAVELCLFRNVGRVLCAKAVEALFGISFIISFFYTYTGALGIESLAIDIASFYVAVIVGKYISYRIIVSDRKPLLPSAASLAVLIIIMAIFIWATVSPAHLPLFRDGQTLK